MPGYPNRHAQCTLEILMRVRRGRLGPCNPLPIANIETSQSGLSVSRQTKFIQSATGERHVIMMTRLQCATLNMTLVMSSEPLIEGATLPVILMAPDIWPLHSSDHRWLSLYRWLSPHRAHNQANINKLMSWSPWATSQCLTSKQLAARQYPNWSLSHETSVHSML